jgi:hypothetical protein
MTLWRQHCRVWSAFTEVLEETFKFKKDYSVTVQKMVFFKLISGTFIA